MIRLPGRGRVVVLNRVRVGREAAVLVPIADTPSTTTTAPVHPYPHSLQCRDRLGLVERELPAARIATRPATPTLSARRPASRAPAALGRRWYTIRIRKRPYPAKPTSRPRSAAAYGPVCIACLRTSGQSSRPCSHTANSRTTRHGLPAANTPAGRSRVTTLPAPMTHRGPIVTPGQMIAPPPTHTSDPISTGLPNSRVRRN